MELTARAGYARRKAGSINGKVCYHNAQNIADYGRLGHAEVVALRIPTCIFEDFVKDCCKLFDKDGLRPDQFGDRGTEHLNLVGIPGGKSSPLADILMKASMASGDKLDFAVGKGDDADVPKVSFIMLDTLPPFHSMLLRIIINFMTVLGWMRIIPICTIHWQKNLLRRVRISDHVRMV